MPVSPWILAIRPKTLPAAISPVLIATAMAWGDGVAHWSSAIFALVAAIFIQIGTNLANDYFDFHQGADQNRVGPIRVTQAGLIKPPVVLKAAIACFVFSLIGSVYLIYRGGWSILIIAILAVLSGFFYTAGKRPIAYRGLGEVFVFIFFGLVAVTGTYYVQALTLKPVVFIAAMAPGFISSAIIGVNNMRDIDGDRKVSKNTLAVRLGFYPAVSLYMFFMIAAAFVPILVFLLEPSRPWVLLACAIAFLAIPSGVALASAKNAQTFNEQLARTSQFLIIYTLIFSLGWLWVF